MHVFTGQKTFCSAVFAPLLRFTQLKLCVNGEMVFWTVVLSRACAERNILFSFLALLPLDASLFDAKNIFVASAPYSP
jgi:hypothetical protein